MNNILKKVTLIIAILTVFCLIAFAGGGKGEIQAEEKIRIFLIVRIFIQEL